MRSGNPIDRQYDINASGGGPLYRGKAWFFLSYRLNDQFRTIIGLDELAQSKLTNYTGKGTFQLSRNNQLIGFWNKRTKLQPLRDFSTLVPVSASYYQGSRNYPMKLEWTSILSDRLFLSVLGAQWYNFFPLRPTYEGGICDRASLQPGRIDIPHGAVLRRRREQLYQDRKRYKPQFAPRCRTSRTAGRARTISNWASNGSAIAGSKATISRSTSSIAIAPACRSKSISTTRRSSAPPTSTTKPLLRDDWKLTNRLTLNLGLRIEHYVDGWPEQ